MSFVESRGRSIYYERDGTGPSVLFLHGAGSNAATWWQQLPAFVPRYTCLTMDIRCFGRSVAPTDEFDLSLFVADVLAVLDAERIEKTVLVGQSLGGMIGLQVALRHPERVAGFVACDSSLAIDHPALIESIERRFRTASAVSIEQRSLGKWFLDTHPDLATLYAQINHFNPSAHSIPAAQWRAAMMALNGAEHLTPATQVGELSCPTLFLVGAEDPIVPSSVMRKLAAMVAGGEVVVIEQAAHSAYFEKPAEFNNHVLDFLSRRVRAS
jgi:3-oxoadipate enol-lactonase